MKLKLNETHLKSKFSQSTVLDANQSLRQRQRGGENGGARMTVVGNQVDPFSKGCEGKNEERRGWMTGDDVEAPSVGETTVEVKPPLIQSLFVVREQRKIGKR